MTSQGTVLSRTDLEELERLVDALDRSRPTERGERSIVVPDTALDVLRRGVARLRASEHSMNIERSGLVSVHEAADILNVPETHVERLLGSGELPSSRTDGERRIPRAELLSFKEGWNTKRLALLEQLVRADEEAGLYQREIEEGW